MRYRKVLVAPFLELGIVALMMGIASFFKFCVEVLDIILNEIVRCEISAASEPPLSKSASIIRRERQKRFESYHFLAVFLCEFEVAIVKVYSRNVRVPRMDN